MGDLKLTYQVDGGDLVQAGEASSQMKMTLKKLGLPPEIIRKASVCMYEGEINMVIHADGGGLLYRWGRGPGPGVRGRNGPAQHEAVLRRNAHRHHGGGGHHGDHADRYQQRLTAGRPCPQGARFDFNQGVRIYDEALGHPGV